MGIRIGVRFLQILWINTIFLKYVNEMPAACNLGDELGISQYLTSPLNLESALPEGHYGFKI